MSRREPRAQRANAQYDNGQFIRTYPDSAWTRDGKGDIPVLVIPESALKDCAKKGHLKRMESIDAEFCTDCGASRLLMMSGRWAKWQPPKLLRVPRRKV